MRQLRGTKSQHKLLNEEDMKDVRAKIAHAKRAIKEGSCTKAYLSIASMWEALGRGSANSRWIDSSAWQPESDIRDVGYEFSQRCLRIEPLDLSGRRRRRS